MANVHENEECFKLIGLIKQKRNAEFKSIILSNVDKPDFSENRDSTLLHTAAVFNNVGIIAFLFGLGYDINARNSLKQTPLVVAILHKKFQTVQNLLSLDADIFATDAETTSSALEICFQKDRNVPEYIILCLFERLKRYGLSAEEMADRLMKAGCPIDKALLMYDAEVTGTMLDFTASLAEYKSRALLARAMESGYLENVRMLLKRGPRSKERRDMFLDIVTKNRRDLNIRPYFQQLVNWEIPDANYLKDLAGMFQNENEDFVQMFLNIGIDEYARNKFGMELLVCLFQNLRIDYNKILKGRQFNVNSLDPFGELGALHLAAGGPNKKGVVYLLNNGADPNLKDAHGETPIFHDTSSGEIFDLLIEIGADVQVVTNQGYTLFDDKGHVIFPLIAILEARGVPIIKQIRRSINQFSSYRNDYSSFLKHLDWMKTYEISETASLFSILTDKVDDIARYVKDEDTTRKLKNVIHKRGIPDTYICLLSRKMDKAIKLRQRKAEVAEILSTAIKTIEPDHLVIEKIVGYLHYGDLIAYDE